MILQYNNKNVSRQILMICKENITLFSDNYQTIKIIDFNVNSRYEIGLRASMSRVLFKNLGLFLFFENLLTDLENQKGNMLLLKYTNQKFIKWNINLIR